MKVCFRFLVMAFVVVSGEALAQKPIDAGSRVTPNLIDLIDHPLRYAPDGQDFVIENGGEFFNRPLYGGNTAFRVDAGDEPEFSLYLPGRGGNLRFGIKTKDAAKWLHETASVVARYRPGTMLYEVRDPSLGAGAVLRLQAIAIHQTDALIVRVETSGLTIPVELFLAYGGLDGKRGARDGDIGTEAVPISQYFQLKPASCLGNEFIFNPAGEKAITVKAKAATIVCLVPPSATLSLADATHWTSPEALLASSTAPSIRDSGTSAGSIPSLPVMTARVPLGPSAISQPLYFALQRVLDSSAPAVAEELADYRNVTSDREGNDRKPPAISLIAPYRYEELPRIFAESDEHFRALRNQIAIETPDPYINAASAALNVAVDAVWDEAEGVVMHGAIAWRAKLLGWRGPYAPDALGWHERAHRHFAYWATGQNTDPIPETLPVPDENANLARSETALHSNGDMSNSHYDMNAVYIDALFRHFQWTGDLVFARQLWPVIERHLAWERRLFRREYGPEKLPLYEAYAMIWASDDLQYSGGGATHASAYNYYHNTQAARLAHLLGKDAAPYEKEAELISRAMRTYLWMPERGMFAEYKDLLGLQRIHPHAALWTFYHTMDSGLASPEEAHRMTDYINHFVPHLPVRGPGVPTDETYQVLSTTDWMPYSWSINNVVMGENIHTALGFWQAGRPEEAFRITKSALLASMFLGICPGNVGTLNYLDVYRREAQRDFADGGGVTSRALVEGLFGLRPDVLAGELLVAPGFPSRWNHASLRHPDASIAFSRHGKIDTYLIEQRFRKLLDLRFQIPGEGELLRVKINGNSISPRMMVGTEADPRFELQSPAEQKYEITVEWKNVSSEKANVPVITSAAQNSTAKSSAYDWTKNISGIAQPIPLASYFNDRVTQIFKNEYRSPRSPFVSLAIPKQGIGAWAGHVNATAEIDDAGLRAVALSHNNRLTLPNGVLFTTPGTPGTPNILFTSLWKNYPASATVPLQGRAHRLYLLMAGSTNFMQSRIDNGEIVLAYKDGHTTRLALYNPDTWWPIEQDYFIDDYQFHVDAPLPPRIDLKTGLIRLLNAKTRGGGPIRGGAATVLQLPLDPQCELKSLTVRTLSNEVVIGLLAATLER